MPGTREAFRSPNCSQRSAATAGWALDVRRHNPAQGAAANDVQHHRTHGLAAEQAKAEGSVDHAPHSDVGLRKTGSNRALPNSTRRLGRDPIAGRFDADPSTGWSQPLGGQGTRPR